MKEKQNDRKKEKETNGFEQDLQMKDIEKGRGSLYLHMLEKKEGRKKRRQENHRQEGNRETEKERIIIQKERRKESFF